MKASSYRMQASGVSMKKLIFQDALHMILKHLIQSPLTEMNFNIDIIYCMVILCIVL